MVLDRSGTIRTQLEICKYLEKRGGIAGDPLAIRSWLRLHALIAEAKFSIVARNITQRTLFYESPYTHGRIDEEFICNIVGIVVVPITAPFFYLRYRFPELLRLRSNRGCEIQLCRLAVG